MTKLVNLTPHPLTFFSPVAEGRKVDMPPAPKVGDRVSMLDGEGTARVDKILPSEGNARLRELRSKGEHIEGLYLTRVRVGEVTDLPAPQGGTVFIVSMVTAQYMAATTSRTDVVYPYGPVRSVTGTVVGCTGLAMVV